MQRCRTNRSAVISTHVSRSRHTTTLIDTRIAGRPAQATAIYWNTLMASGLLAGPAVKFIAQAYDFWSVIQIASGVALFAAVILIAGRQNATIAA